MTEMKIESPWKATPGWKPAVELPLVTASSTAFRLAIATLDKHFADNPVAPLDIPNGWYDVTPELAEDLLRRNRHNRKPSLSVVRKYYHSMANGGWMPTGQALLINQDGIAEDLQHRALAAFFGKVSFRTFIIANVPVIPDLFAYIDDSKPRSAADALYTSGNDGQSGLLAAAIKLAWRYEHNGFAIFAKNQPTMREMNSREVLSFSRENPEMGAMAHLLVSNYEASLEVVGPKAVAVLFGWLVDKEFGNDTLAVFLEKLAEDDEADTTVIPALRKRLLDAQAEPTKALEKGHVLALLIKGFRYWITNADRKLFTSARTGKPNLHLTDNEEYPSVEDIHRELAAQKQAAPEPVAGTVD